MIEKKSSCHNMPIEYFRNLELDDHMGVVTVEVIPLCTKCHERCTPVMPLAGEDFKQAAGGDENV